ncbi:uncharacterized protein [Prorops nasuta]
MFFLWSREASQVRSSRTGPWLAWLATGFLLWRCRRRIAKVIAAASPLRLLRRPRCSSVPTRQLAPGQSCQKLKSNKVRVKRLCTGDGPHVTSTIVPLTQTTSRHMVDYRVTRSGRVYGKYQHRILTPL